MLRRSSHDTLDSLDPLRPSHAERDVLLGSKSSIDVAMFKLPSSSESMVSCCVPYREGRLCVFKQNEWTNACVSRIQWVGLNSAFEEEASLWWDARRERAGNALVSRFEPHHSLSCRRSCPQKQHQHALVQIVPLRERIVSKAIQNLLPVTSCLSP